MRLFVYSGTPFTHTYHELSYFLAVSGLWGIFYFHEICGLETITKWIASASVTICGIILLSYEHHKKQ